MHMKYAPRSPDDIVTLIGDHPLCWIVSHSEAGFGATPLPLLTECDDSGALVSLLGGGRRTGEGLVRGTSCPS